MLNRSEGEEREYFQAILAKLNTALEHVNQRISLSYQKVHEAKKYIWENITQLDPAERAANRVEVSMMIDTGEMAIAEQRKIRKLIQSPYFGRIDFIDSEAAEADVIYIGVHSFADKNNSPILIFDWRSPVASMYYDFGTGKAFYGTYG